MRTTLDIDDDVLRALRERARRESKTLGEVVSELARSSLSEGFTGLSLDGTHYGLHPFPKRGGVVTNELIDALRAGDV